MTNHLKGLLSIVPIFILVAYLHGTASAQGSSSSPRTFDAQFYRELSREPLGEQTSLILNLNLIRLMPSVLDQDKALFTSFILLNNCHSPQIQNQLNSEFDYPKVAQFYKTHATQIVNGSPASIIVPVHIDLGQYDASQSSFPFRAKVGLQDCQEGLTTNRRMYQSGAFMRGCAINFRFQGLHDTRGIDDDYYVVFNQITIKSIPMDEDSARRYVQGLPDARSRPMDIAIEVQLSSDPPKIIETLAEERG